MKKILIPISNNYFARAFFLSDALSEIRKYTDMLEVVFYCDQRKKQYYERNFQTNNCRFEILPEYGFVRIERVFRYIESASINTKTQKMLSKGELNRKGSGQTFILKYFWFWLDGLFHFLGRYKTWRNIVRKAYFLSPREKTIMKIFDLEKPDLLFAPGMIGKDYMFLKEAQKRGVKTIGMILSWDNLYSKTLPRLKPDKLLVHTESIKKQAIRLGDFEEKNIEVIGVPQYDAHISRHCLRDRKEYMKENGLDPSKKTILYALSGKRGREIDIDMISFLHKGIYEKKISANVQVIVRPYPRFDMSKELAEAIKNRFGFFVENPVEHIYDGNNGWEFSAKSVEKIVNSIYHSDVVISMYTTFFIEAAIYDKPIIAVAYDGKQENDYWNSARRFFDWDHLAEIRDLGGIAFVKSESELYSAINKAINSPSEQRSGRKCIVREQVGLVDGASAKRLVNAIVNMLV